MGEVGIDRSYTIFALFYVLLFFCFLFLFFFCTVPGFHFIHPFQGIKKKVHTSSDISF